MSRKILDDNFNDEYYEQMSKNEWICKQAIGESVLEVECSYGENVIRLAKESKSVTGIDSSLNKIERARKELENESDYTRKSAHFKVRNLFLDMEKDELFDSIIFDNILSTITDVSRYIKKASLLLGDNGRIIVTVPFGTKQIQTTKVPYYYSNLKEFETEEFFITEISYLGEDIGVILEKTTPRTSVEVSDTIMRNMEKAFIQREENNVKQLMLQQDVKEQVKDKKEFDRKEVSEKPKANHVNNKVEETLKRKNNELSIKFKKMNQQANSFKSKLVKEKREKVKQSKLLLEAYKKEERLLKTHSNLQDRYHALSNSKLGKLTLKYWAWRRRRRNK